jgi:hypothetical protein
MLDLTLELDLASKAKLALPRSRTREGPAWEWVTSEADRVRAAADPLEAARQWARHPPEVPPSVLAATRATRVDDLEAEETCHERLPPEGR